MKTPKLSANLNSNRYKSMCSKNGNEFIPPLYLNRSLLDSERYCQFDNPLFQ
ncbi:hypothetical protein BCR42DRAFT_400313 [Absidia repens]|uniref:Uncharacterized protein n=1 Tax=Absidia repens TaxID=90262 RepID=A0A1X2J131_9FUNG|nr:hypothetical protein BCR42DRAFT_400313 [Absidia repens]